VKFNKLARVAIVVGLVTLLLPINTAYIEEKNSRLYTLRTVPANNNYHMWNDLYQYLNTLESTRILTDQVTGYTINGLTRHRYRGRKFYGFWSFKTDRKKYDKRMFKNKDDWLLVINKRDGGNSMVGRLSRHWSEGVLKVSNYYSKEFEDFVDKNGDVFHKLWQGKNIRVYRIKVS